MIIKTLYVYTKPNGETVATLTKPTDYEYTTRVRLIAEENRAITNGQVACTVIDTDSAEGWTDCDLPEDTVNYGYRLQEQEEKIKAQEEQISSQNEQITMLTDCILEMSEKVYNE